MKEVIARLVDWLSTKNYQAELLVLTKKTESGDRRVTLDVTLSTDEVITLIEFVSELEGVSFNQLCDELSIKVVERSSNSDVMPPKISPLN